MDGILQPTPITIFNMLLPLIPDFLNIPSNTILILDSIPTCSNKVLKKIKMSNQGMKLIIVNIPPKIPLLTNSDHQF